jgi:hypothetical protein
MDGRGSNLGRIKIFPSLLYNACSEIHPAFHANGAGNELPGGKIARTCDHSLPSSAEVKNCEDIPPLPMCLCGIVPHYLSAGIILPYLYFSISTDSVYYKFTPSNITSDTFIVVMFVILDLYKAFHEELGSMLMIYVHKTLHIPSSSCSTVIVVEPNIMTQIYRHISAT